MKRKRDTEEAVDGSPKVAAPHRSAPTPSVVLQELFDLLEDYAPMWYTEEMRDRVLSALSSRFPKRMNRSA